MWPFTQRQQPDALKLGDYLLGQEVGDNPNLTEISALEYKALPKSFVGERTLKAPDVIFLGYRWNLLLGTINGQIYKMSAQFISDSSELADAAYSKSVAFCLQQYGLISKDQDGIVSIWKTPFGNIIVDRQVAFSEHYVNLTVTSGALVRSGIPLGK